MQCNLIRFGIRKEPGEPTRSTSIGKAGLWGAGGTPRSLIGPGALHSQGVFFTQLFLLPRPCHAVVAQPPPRPLRAQLVFVHFPKMNLEAAKVCVTTITSQGLVSSLHPEPPSPERVTVYVMGEQQAGLEEPTAWVAQLKRSSLVGPHSPVLPAGRGGPVSQELSTQNKAQELLFRNHKALVPQPFPGATFQRELGEDPAEQVGAVLGVIRAKRCRKDGQSPAPARPGASCSSLDAVHSPGTWTPGDGGGRRRGLLTASVRLLPPASETTKGDSDLRRSFRTALEPRPSPRCSKGPAGQRRQGRAPAFPPKTLPARLGPNSSSDQRPRESPLCPAFPQEETNGKI